MGRWIKVADVCELAPGAGRTVVAGKEKLALFNDDGKYYAIADTCPHKGASLGQGVMHDGRVICPLHSWVFELRTGRCPRESHEPVETFPARCSDNAIEVQIPGDA